MLMPDSEDLQFAPRPYTLELLTGMARVQAQYLLRVLREEGGTFAARAVTRTPWRGLLPDRCQWDDFLLHAEALLLRDLDALPEADRIERFLAYVSPLFAGSVMASEREYLGQRWFGCFRYHAHPDMNAISLHVRNNIMPRSPFDDLPACARSLRRLGKAAEAIEPFDIAEVMCGSWLNDLPVFLALFPATYRESLEVSPPDSRDGFGWWGQLIDKRGCLHARRAAMIRDTGRFPHARKYGRCDFSAFMRHLKSIDTD